VINISYSVFIDNSKNLVFPTMCDAYVKLEYAKHNITNKLGIWDISGSFTGQFVIKPYDVNGYGDSTLEDEIDKTANGGAGNNSSRKTMPSIAENITNNPPDNNHDQKYLPNSERYSHKMCIFHNNNMSLYLVNTTTHNQNNPAEYKIEFTVKIGGTASTIQSPTVFTSRKYHYADTSKVQSQTTPSGATVQLWNDYHLQFLYDGYKVIGKEAGQPPYVNNANEYNAGWTIKYTPNSTPTSGYDPNTRQVGITINNPVGNQPQPRYSLPVGMELFNDKGVSLGTILQHTISTHHSIIMNPLPVVHTVPTFTDGSKIYVPVEREPMYIQTTAHIGIGFEQSTKRMSIFYNGIEVATGTHGSSSGNFSFDASDIYLGQSANLSYPNNRKTQFMGEYNSVLFTDTYMTKFTSLFNTLAPYSDIKLYYDFSEGRDD
tara:strand:+ start:1256 stop:2551 length:1296 start_codon:yes stop_codon:yes gene_type:complete